MYYLSMKELLLYNTKKSKRTKLIATIVQISIMIIWFSFMLIINLNNLFWLKFLNIVNYNDIALFYRSLFFGFAYIYLGWLLSFVIVNLIFKNAEIRIEEFSLKFFLIHILLSLLVNSATDIFLFVLHFFVFGYIGNVIWEKIYKSFYDYNPKMELVRSVSHLDDIISNDTNKSEFILINNNTKKCIPWFYIDFKDNHIFSEEIIKTLKDNNVPTNILTKLKYLKTKVFLSRKEFIHNLMNVLSDIEYLDYQSIILKNFDFKNKDNYIVEYVDKNSINSFQQLTVSFLFKSCFNAFSYSDFYSNNSLNKYNLYHTIAYDVLKSRE